VETESLIDLNIKPDHASIMRHRALSDEDLNTAAISGLLIGLIIGVIFCIAIFFFSFGAIAEDRWSVGKFMWFAIFIMAICLFVGAIKGRAGLVLEFREGFVKVNEENFQYWSKTGEEIIRLEKIFGAAPETDGSKEHIRICCLVNHPEFPSGFTYLIPDFKRYEPISGPAMEFASSNDNGNAIARKIILYHINKRKEHMWPVAEVPPYRFESVRSHHKNVLWGENVIDESFSCDGKLISISKGNEIINIPVTAIKSVLAEKESSQNSSEKYDLTLILDSSCGCPMIKLNLLNMSFAEEVERYCRCMATVFPQP
jgi:hypothetical protein